ncbi:hypothetical protein ACB098_05G016700 [Castanea mollissima]
MATDEPCSNQWCHPTLLLYLVDWLSQGVRGRPTDGVRFMLDGKYGKVMKIMNMTWKSSYRWEQRVSTNSE